MPESMYRLPFVGGPAHGLNILVTPRRIVAVFEPGDAEADPSLRHRYFLISGPDGAPRYQHEDEVTRRQVAKK